MRMKLMADPQVNPIPKKAAIIELAISFSWSSTRLVKNIQLINIYFIIQIIVIYLGIANKQIFAMYPLLIAKNAIIVIKIQSE